MSRSLLVGLCSGPCYQAAAVRPDATMAGEETPLTIADLHDDLLARIFEHVPALDRRAVLPLVCPRWNAALSPASGRVGLFRDVHVDFRLPCGTRHRSEEAQRQLEPFGVESVPPSAEPAMDAQVLDTLLKTIASDGILSARSFKAAENDCLLDQIASGKSLGPLDEACEDDADSCDSREVAAEEPAPGQTDAQLMTRWLAERGQWVESLTIENGEVTWRKKPRQSHDLTSAQLAPLSSLRGAGVVSEDSASSDDVSDSDYGVWDPDAESFPTHTFDQRGFSDLFPLLPRLIDLRIYRCAPTMTSGAFPGLACLTGLTRLEVHGLSGPIYPPHLHFLSTLRTLRHLALTTTPEDAPDVDDDMGLTDFPTVLLAATQLEYLNLSGNTLLVYLPPDISTLVNLRELVVQDTSLMAQRELGQLPALTRLDMQINVLAGETVAEDFYGDVEELGTGLGQYRSRRVLAAVQGAVAGAGFAAGEGLRFGTATGGGARGSDRASADDAMWKDLASVADSACHDALSSLGLSSLDDLNLTFPVLRAVRDLNLASCSFSVLPVHLATFSSLVSLSLRSNNIGGLPRPFSSGAFLDAPPQHLSLDWIGKSPSQFLVFARDLYAYWHGWELGGEESELQGTRQAQGSGDGADDDWGGEPRPWLHLGAADSGDDLGLALSWRAYLSQSLPLVPALLPHLEFLDVSNNLLCVIPDSLLGFPNLKHLDLSYNILQVLHPGVLAANPSIEALHLRGNPSLGPSLAADGILGVALAAAAKARSAGPAGAEGEGESGPRGLRYCEASGAVLAGPPGTREEWGVSDLEALVRHKAAGLRELESQVR